MKLSFTAEPSVAAALDADDPLASFREQFHLPVRHGKVQTYLCGHSLGLQPRRTQQLIEEELHHWRTDAVEGHFNAPRPWLSYHELLTTGLAALTGSLSTEVVAMNSLTVNLHLMLTSFYRPTSQRFKILIEDSAFPSDRYAAASQIKLHGHDPASALITIPARDGEDTLRTGDIIAVLQREGHNIATVLLPGVQYLTGQCLDIETITRVAHQHGCTVGFDLAHAIGNVPLQLHQWDVDFAVWCSYKYLNSGPGAIGGCFVHERHAHDFSLPRLAGWWGHDKHTRFAMPAEFSAIPGAEGWQLSNPPILACAPLLASLELFEHAGASALRNKSLLLTAYLRYLLQHWLKDRVDIITPPEDEAHGCQLSLRMRVAVDHAREIHRALLESGCVVDWREPDIIRVAPVPLYNRFADVWTFANALREIMQ